MKEGVAGRKAVTGTALLLALVAAIIGWFCCMVIWIGDDVYYQYKITAEPTRGFVIDLEHINSVGDFISSQCAHYLVSNGRVVAHFIVQLYEAALGQTAFAVSNAAVWVLFLWLIIRQARAEGAGFGTWLTATCLALTAFATKMMPSTQVGYIWMGCVILCFVYLYQSERNLKAWQLALLFIFSIIAGNAQEAYGVGVSVAIATDFIRLRGRFTPRKWIMAAGFALGMLIIILSPETFARMDRTVIPLSESLFTLILSLKIVYVLAAVMVYQKVCHRRPFRLTFKENRFWFTAIIATVLFSLAIGVFTDRQLFCAELGALVILLRILRRHSFTTGWLATLAVYTALFLCVQGWRTVEVRQAMLELEQKYPESADGIVYAERWTGGTPNYLNIFPIQLYEEPGEEFSSGTLRKIFIDRTGRPDSIYVLPKALEGLDTVDVGNSFIRLTDGASQAIVFVSKRQPARFEVKRKLLGIFPWKSKKNPTNNLLRETDLWRAYLVFGHFPFISVDNVVFSREEDPANP